MRQISKKEARKRFIRNQPFTICPCKMRPGGPCRSDFLVYPAHIREWKVRAEWYRGNETLWEGTIDETAWHLFYNNWKWANSLDDETGMHATYWIE